MFSEHEVFTVITKELQVTILAKILTIYVEGQTKNTWSKISIFYNSNLISQVMTKAASREDIWGIFFHSTNKYWAPPMRQTALGAGNNMNYTHEDFVLVEFIFNCRGGGG